MVSGWETMWAKRRQMIGGSGRRWCEGGDCLGKAVTTRMQWKIQVCITSSLPPPALPPLTPAKLVCSRSCATEVARVAQVAAASSRSAGLCMWDQEPSLSMWHHTPERPGGPMEGSIKQQVLPLLSTDVHKDIQSSLSFWGRWERYQLTLPLTVSKDRVTGGRWSDFSSICQPITVILPTRSLSADLQQTSCLDKHGFLRQGSAILGHQGPGGSKTPSWQVLPLLSRQHCLPLDSLWEDGGAKLQTLSKE